MGWVRRSAYAYILRSVLSLEWGRLNGKSGKPVGKIASRT
jgi:hypothetical protein